MLLRWRLIVIMLLLSFWGAVTHSPMLFAADEKEKITFVPSVDYKSFLIKQAVKTADKRDRVINILNDLLKIYPEGEERAQLKLRLAHLYLDKARHLYFFELYKNDVGWEIANVSFDAKFEREIDEASRVSLNN
jgi:hypothetical protein